MRARFRDDQGFTLIEIVVSTLLFSLVAIAIGGILIGASAAEREVRTVSAATNAGQLVARTVEDAVTNAALPILITTVGTNDQLLQVRTAGRGATVSWTCAGFYYSAASGTIRYTTSSASLVGTTAASQASWTLLADGVAKQGTTDVFQASGSTGVIFTFTVDSGTTNPVAFASTVTSRTNVSGSAPCF